MVVVTSG